MYFSTLMIPMSLSFILLNHPMSMGFNILMMTVVISLSTGMMNSTFWFSYILFLIFIGGLLILFIYMTSIASNEKFKFSKNITMIWIFTTIITLMFFSKNYMHQTINKETEIYINQLNFMTTNLKYFSPSLVIILISMMIYLLVVLIMIVKITKKEKGPIRQI